MVIDIELFYWAGIPISVFNWLNSHHWRCELNGNNLFLTKDPELNAGLDFEKLPILSEIDFRTASLSYFDKNYFYRTGQILPAIRLQTFKWATSTQNFSKMEDLMRPSFGKLVGWYSVYDALLLDEMAELQKFKEECGV